DGLFLSETDIRFRAVRKQRPDDDYCAFVPRGVMQRGESVRIHGVGIGALVEQQCCDLGATHSAGDNQSREPVLGMMSFGFAPALWVAPRSQHCCSTRAPIPTPWMRTD